MPFNTVDIYGTIRSKNVALLSSQRSKFSKGRVGSKATADNQQRLRLLIINKRPLKRRSHHYFLTHNPEVAVHAACIARTVCRLGGRR